MTNVPNVNVPRLMRVLVATLLGIFLACSITIAKNYTTILSGTLGPLRSDGEILGGDFVGLYSAGKVAQNQRGDLYDFDKALEAQKTLLLGTTAKPIILPFAYPPILGAVYEALSHYDYRDAYVVCLLFSLGAGLLAMVIMAKALDSSLPEAIGILLLTISFAPFSIFCLAGGQTSVVGLLIVSVTFYFLNRGRTFVAGCILGLGFYKPPLFVIFGLLQLLRGQWRFVFGAITGISMIILSSWVYIGTQGMVSYVARSMHYIYGAEVVPGYTLPPNQGVGLLALLFRVFPQSEILVWAIYGLLILAALYVLSNRQARDSVRSDLQYAIDISVSLFLSIQMLRYDLTILLVPLVIVLNHSYRAKDMHLFLLAYIGTLALYTYYFFPIEISSSGNPGAYAFTMSIWVIAILLWRYRVRWGVSSFNKVDL